MAVKRSEKAKTIAHVIAGVAILLKGYTKWEADHALLGGFFVLLGLVLILATIWHHQLTRWIRDFDLLVFLIEMIVLGLIAYSYYQEGKKGLPWVYGLMTIVYLVLFIVFYRRWSVTNVKH